MLVDQYCSSDLDAAVKIGSNTIIKADKHEPGILYKNILILVEISRRCIRDKACRYRHFPQDLRIMRRQLLDYHWSLTHQ